MWPLFPPVWAKHVSGTTDSLAAPRHSQAVDWEYWAVGSVKWVDVASDIVGASAYGTLDSTASNQFPWDVAFLSPGTHGGDRLHSRNTLFAGHLSNSASSLLLAFLHTALGVPQPFLGAQLWPVAAQSCSQDRLLVCASLSRGLAGVGGCPGPLCAVWRAAELQAVTGLLHWQLAPEGRLRAAHGSASHREAVGLRSTLGKEHSWPLPAAWAGLSSNCHLASGSQQLPPHRERWRGCRSEQPHSSKGRSPRMWAGGLELGWKADKLGEPRWGRGSGAGALVGPLSEGGAPPGWESCRGARGWGGRVGPWDGVGELGGCEWLRKSQVEEISSSGGIPGQGLGELVETTGPSQRCPHSGEEMAPVGRRSVQETCRKALRSERPRGLPLQKLSPQDREWRARAGTAETGRPLVSLIPSVNSWNAIYTIKRKKPWLSRDLQQWAELYTSLDSLF